MLQSDFKERKVGRKGEEGKIICKVSRALGQALISDICIAAVVRDGLSNVNLFTLR